MVNDSAAPVRVRKKITKEGVWGLALACSPLVGFLLFGVIPMVLAIVMAFLNVKGFSFDGATFAGLDNFKNILTDSKFYRSILNTLLAAISMPISLVLALIVSVLLNQQIKGKKIFRTIFFIPYVCSVVAITIMWRWIFDANYGIINSILMKMHLQPVMWLSDSAMFMVTMIIIGIWSGTGFGIILYTAALTNVNPAYYEAAKIDGANSWKQFLNVTLPSISPTTFYLFIMGLIGALQEFARFQIMDPNLSLGEGSLTIVYYLYNNAFKYFKMGMASTVAILLTLVILGITWLNFKLSKRWVHYD